MFQVSEIFKIFGTSQACFICLKRFKCFKCFKCPRHVSNTQDILHLLNVDHRGACYHIYIYHWLVVYPALRKMMEFVSWDHEIPNWMESHKIPWFQTTNQLNELWNITMFNGKIHYKCAIFNSKLLNPLSKPPTRYSYLHKSLGITRTLWQFARQCCGGCFQWVNSPLRPAMQCYSHWFDEKICRKPRHPKIYYIWG